MLEKIRERFHKHTYRNYGKFTAMDGTKYWVRKCDICDMLFWQKLN